jgi:hypothetical protein
MKKCEGPKNQLEKPGKKNENGGQDYLGTAFLKYPGA